MGEDINTVGALYMDGIQIDGPQLAEFENIVSYERCKEVQFGGSISIDIEVDPDSTLYKMCGAVERLRVYAVKLLCNNWRRKHKLPLIRKGTKIYEVKKGAGEYGRCNG